MKFVIQSKLMQAAAVLTSALFVSTAIPVAAQDYPSAPPSFSQGQVDSLVSRIALYPDPLLAQVFAAASFPDQIPEAAQWANQYQNLHGEQLADAIYQANLPFDPAIQALIPFPSVLDMMARDMNWTSALGNAVLVDRPAVMDAVQRMRRSAEEYGYLRSNQQMRVVDSGYGVEIQPVDPALIYVPTYDPYIVYAPPRPGFYLGSAIGFGSCYSIGAFGGWGWGGGFNWYNHGLIVNRSVWGRTWYNRDVYVHNYGNWDRGNWRNSYVVDRGGYSHGGDRGFYRGESYNRGGNDRSYQQNRGYDRGYSNSNMYSGGSSYRDSRQSSQGAVQQQSAPQYQNRGFGQGYGTGSRSGQQQTPVYQAPVQQQAAPQNQNRGFYGGGQRNGQQAPAYQAPVQQQAAPQYQNRGSSQGYGASYRGGQQAPAYQAPVQQSAPQYQNRSFSQGYSGGQRAMQQAPSYQAPSYQAPSSQGRGFYGGGSRGSQPAMQSAPSRSYDRSGSGFRGNSQSAPQSRGNEGGHERGGFGGRR